MENAAWKFDDPPNVAVFTSRRVMDGLDWIALVFHDAEDGSWQFHGVEATRKEDAVLLALTEIIAIDPSLIELHDLPPGWRASRVSSQAQWERCEDIAIN